MFGWIKRLFKQQKDIPVYTEPGELEDPIIAKLINEAWRNGYAEHRSKND